VTYSGFRFLGRFDEELFDYIDSISEISTRQLLALCILAIDDEERLREKQVSREDAFRALIQGMYEIQRGYNLNIQNIDDEQADAPICTVGTFNKLVSCLWGLHPDCVIYVITKETANAKLLPVIIEKAMDFLKHEQQTRSRDDFAALLREIRSDALTPIWENIKRAVYASMEEEFGGLLTRPEMDAAQDCVELDLSSFSDALPAAAASVAAGGMFSASRTQNHERDDRAAEEEESPSLGGARSI
jgi:hypothetical protein